MLNTGTYVDVFLITWLPEVLSLVNSTERANESLCPFYLKVSFARYKIGGSIFYS